MIQALDKHQALIAYNVQQIVALEMMEKTNGLTTKQRHQLRTCRIALAALTAKQKARPAEMAADIYSEAGRLNWTYEVGKTDGWNACALHLTGSIGGESK